MSWGSDGEYESSAGGCVAVAAEGGGRLRFLDLFSGAGGAAMGLHLAFPDAEIVGVDVVFQKNYPFTFVRADAMTFPLEGFDFIWASPPCQAYTPASGRSGRRQRREYPDLVAATRERLLGAGCPWLIENVPGAPVATVVMLCGSMFGLDVRRHRLFECSFLALAPGCRHDLQSPRFRSLDSRRAGKPAAVVGVHGHLNYAGERELRRRAMDIDWMTTRELSQAIPPAYSRYLARFIPLRPGVAAS